MTMKGHQIEWMILFQDTGVIEMMNQIVQEIEEDLKNNDYNDFLNYLGIEPEDFKEFNESIDFDDYSF